MTARCSRSPAKPSYYVVMVDLGRLGLEAVVQPEMTRQNVISRLNTGEYGSVVFIDYVADGIIEDVTHELIDEADRQAKAEYAAERAAYRAARDSVKESV
jgi:hypothetical protein